MLQRASKPRISGAMLALLGLGLVMSLSMPWFSVFDDEAYIISTANEPDYLVRYAVYQAHQHPPLSDLFLHVWLRIAGQDLWLIRLPFLLFYLLGIWFTALVAEQVAGGRAFRTTLGIAILWPLGFHYGRAAGWYTPSFLLVALLTWSYLVWLQQRRTRNLVVMGTAAIALVYTNYFGWAFIGILLLDFFFRERRSQKEMVAALSGIAALALAFSAYWPRLFALVNPAHILSNLIYGAYSTYSIFVSEAVAPWALPWSAFVVVAMMVCVALTFASHPESRRFLLYFAIALLALCLVGGANPKRLMFLCPWLLVALGIALSKLRTPKRRVFLVALIVIGSVGAIGIATRKYYSSFQWTEPWRATVAEIIGDGKPKTIATSHPSALFYLFAALPTDRAEYFRLGHPLFAQHGIVSPYQENPTPRYSGRVVLLRGALDRFYLEQLDILSKQCRAVARKVELRDTGWEFKKKYFPSVQQPEWRIEVSEFDCP